MKNSLSRYLGNRFVWLSVLASLSIGVAGCMRLTSESQSALDKLPVFSEEEFNADKKNYADAEDEAHEAARIPKSSRNKDNASTRAEIYRKYLVANKNFSDKYPAEMKLKDANGKVTIYMDLGYNRYEKGRIYYQGLLDEIQTETYDADGKIIIKPASTTAATKDTSGTNGSADSPTTSSAPVDNK